MRIFLSPYQALAATAFAVAGTVLVIGLLVGWDANADDDEEYVPPVRDEIVQAECSACHMAYPPSLLPARSWQAIMSGLGDHFGENASLDEATGKHITDYLVANAADAKGRRPGVLRGLGADETPLRISDTPWWIREHRGEVGPGAFEDPRVGSKANCGACHQDAARGIFEDD
jgi:hypothetical protein